MQCDNSITLPRDTSSSRRARSACAARHMQNGRGASCIVLPLNSRDLPLEAGQICSTRTHGESDGPKTLAVQTNRSDSLGDAEQPSAEGV